MYVFHKNKFGDCKVSVFIDIGPFIFVGPSCKWKILILYLTLMRHLQILVCLQIKLKNSQRLVSISLVLTEEISSIPWQHFPPTHLLIINKGCATNNFPITGITKGWSCAVYCKNISVKRQCTDLWDYRSNNDDS